jgi:hypothetical protein
VSIGNDLGRNIMICASLVFGGCGDIAALGCRSLGELGLSEFVRVETELEAVLWACGSGCRTSGSRE